MSLAGWFARSVALCVKREGIVSLIGLPGIGIHIADGGIVRITHEYLGSLDAGGFGYVFEGQVPIVDKKLVVVTGMVEVFEVTKVLVHEVADEQVQPAVQVDVRAADACCGAGIHVVGECRFGDVHESAILHVEEQRVQVALLRRPEAQVVRRIAPCADIKVLEAVVVDVACDGTCAMRVLESDTGGGADITERVVAVVAVEEIPVACHLGYIEVHIAVAVVVEDYHAGPVVPHSEAVLQRRVGDIREGDYGSWVISLSGDKGIGLSFTKETCNLAACRKDKQ